MRVRSEKEGSGELPRRRARRDRLRSRPLPASPASALVATSATVTVPQSVSVGQSGLEGSFTATNINSAPDGFSSNTVLAFQMAPSCAVAPGTFDVCAEGDPGVFDLAATATGAAGTVCAGENFTVSAPDAGGRVLFAPSSTVVLGPPGGTSGDDRCTVDFTFSVVDQPTIDVEDENLTLQTRWNVRVHTQASPSQQAIGIDTKSVTVGTAPAPPRCAGVGATRVGTAGRDVINGTAGRDVVLARGGNDLVRGLRGNDLVCGGRGNDTVAGGAGRDTLLGQAGADILKGGRGPDILRGGPGPDVLKGGPGPDTLNGGPGNDIEIQ